jgi:PAS domain S-box-containing protein
MKTLTDMRLETEIPVIIADHQGLITYVNPPFERVFGWKSDEAQGQALTIIIPKTMRDSHHMGFSRFLTTGVPTLLNKALNLKAITKSGMELNCEHFIVAEQELGQWIFGATLKPL